LRPPTDEGHRNVSPGKTTFWSAWILISTIAYLVMSRGDVFDIDLPIDKTIWNRIAQVRRNHTIATVAMFAGFAMTTAITVSGLFAVPAALLVVCGGTVMVLSDRELGNIYPKVTRKNLPDRTNPYADRNIRPSYLFLNAHPAFVRAVKVKFGV
jgi:hypothetical protein